MTSRRKEGHRRCFARQFGADQVGNGDAVRASLAIYPVRLSTSGVPIPIGAMQ